MFGFLALIWFFVCIPALIIGIIIWTIRSIVKDCRYVPSNSSEKMVKIDNNDPERLVYFTRFPEFVEFGLAASRKPPGRIPLADKVYGSLLFSYVNEELFVKINPLNFGYTIGIYDEMPNNSASTHYRFYSDQSHLQYVYFVYRINGNLFFSLIVACFEDSCDDDHSDPNRVRFLEYLNDHDNCFAIKNLFCKPYPEFFQGYFVLDFKSPPQRVSESEIPPEKWPIIHISTHQNRDFGNIDFGEIPNEADANVRVNKNEDGD